MSKYLFKVVALIIILFYYFKHQPFIIQGNIYIYIYKYISKNK